MSDLDLPALDREFRARGPLWNPRSDAAVVVDLIAALQAARWKLERVEADFAVLRRSYDALRAERDALIEDRARLIVELQVARGEGGHQPCGDPQPFPPYTGRCELPAGHVRAERAEAELAQYIADANDGYLGVLHRARTAESRIAAALAWHAGRCEWQRSDGKLCAMCTTLTGGDDDR